MEVARRLKVMPTDCLAVEDSVNGMVAAKAARMRVLAIPDAEQQDDPRFSLADWECEGFGGVGGGFGRVVNGKMLMMI
ncbi:MAG: hypothetical protein R3B47_14640 [Bacteroidia bacterium]